MLSISSSRASCCSAARKVTAARASNLSTSAGALDASPSDTQAQHRQHRIFKRVLRAAVVGSQDLEARRWDPPAKGQARVPDYIDHGYKPTPTRGRPRSNVNYRSSTDAGSKSTSRRPRPVASKASNRHSFSTTARSPSSFSSFRPTERKAQMRIALEDAADQDLPLDVNLEGDIEAAYGPRDIPITTKGKTKATSSGTGQLTPGCWIETRR